MVDKLKKIWVEGEFVDWDDAKIHVLSHTLHYGLGAFEGIRAYQRADGGTYVFRLNEHITRLFDTCKLIMIKPRFSPSQITEVCLEIFRRNDLESGYVRPLMYVGE